MRLTVHLCMEYALDHGDPALLAITAAEAGGQTVLDTALAIEDATLLRIEGEGGRGDRIWALPEGCRLKLDYRATVEVARPDAALASLGAAPWHQLPGEVLTFLRPSRYCPSDLFATFATRQFGHLAGGDRVAAIRDWVAGNLAYVPGSSNTATTALDSFVSREGVCRDYAHLVCALARATDIPARYTTGYGPGVDPPDFHAVAEVWLDQAWHIVDATGMSAAADLVVIGSGRDAGDVPFMETRNWATPLRQSIRVAPA